MSHAVVIVVTDNPTEKNITEILAPFNEQDEKYMTEFQDETNDIKKAYKDYLKENPKITLEQFAKNDGYKKNGKKFGYYSNPNRKWDWWTIGGRWNGMIEGKNVVQIKELKKPEDVHAFAIMKDGVWHEKGSLGFWGFHDTSNKTKVVEKFSKKELDEYIYPTEAFMKFKDEFIEKILRLVKENYELNSETLEFTIKEKYNVKELADVQFFTDLAWDKSFYNDFIKTAKPTDYLVVVDYHI